MGSGVYPAFSHGSVKILDAVDCGELQVFNPDENAKILQGLLLMVDESYSHCPRALAFSKLWDSEQMESNKKLKFLDEWKPGM